MRSASGGLFSFWVSKGLSGSHPTLRRLSKIQKIGSLNPLVSTDRPRSSVGRFKKV